MMAAISVRGLDEDVARRLKMRAVRHGRSMEAEVRAILTDVVRDRRDHQVNLAQAIRDRFAGTGGVDLASPPRRDLPRAADLSIPS